MNLKLNRLNINIINLFILFFKILYVINFVLILNTAFFSLIFIYSFMIFFIIFKYFNLIHLFD